MASAVSATETRVKTSVRSVDELSGIGLGDATQPGVDVTPMDNGDLAYIQNAGGVGNGLYYHLDKESGVTPDGVNVLYTTAARLSNGDLGRWLLGPDANSSAVNIDYKFLDEDQVNNDETQWVDLLVSSALFATNLAQKLLINATISGNVFSQAGNGGGEFRLIVDGAPLVIGNTQGTSISMTSPVQPPRLADSAAVSEVVAVPAVGLQHIRLQWRAVKAGDSVRIGPVTFPRSDHASLIVQLLG